MSLAGYKNGSFLRPSLTTLKCVYRYRDRDRYNIDSEKGGTTLCPDPLGHDFCIKNIFREHRFILRILYELNRID